ncbi:MAG TPA: hypothetical protein VD767_00440 [Thermomicrobiales bacterium]|nr:hypothetical protein [Thermomicrobiales bacterium]
MRQVILVLAMATIASGPAVAQSNRVYVAGVFAASSGTRGPVDVGTFPTAGGLVGLRLSGAWSVEFELDRGFGESSERTYEGLLTSQVSGPGPYSREELERNGIFGRSVWSDSVATGYSAQAVWKSREPGRVNVALLGGLSWRTFDRFHSMTITSVGPGVTYPAGHPNLRSFAETSPLTGGGLTAGVLVPIRVAAGLTVAPEFRVTLGLITDESTYKVAHTGVRVMWGF